MVTMINFSSEYFFEYVYALCNVYAAMRITANFEFENKNQHFLPES